MPHYEEQTKFDLGFVPETDNGILYEREEVEVRDLTTDENGFVTSEVKGRWTLLAEERMLKARSKIKGIPATVRVEVGLTINIDNYESARITVGIAQPVNSVPSEIEAARDDMTRYITDFVYAKRTKLVGTAAQRAALIKMGMLRLEEFPPKVQAEIKAILDPQGVVPA
jgi:hypothetical protein